MKKIIEIENKILNLLSESDRAECLLFAKQQAYPYNKVLHIAANKAISKGLISEDDYKKIISEYSNSNPNMKIFEYSSPRGFGEKFAQEHLKTSFPKILDPKDFPQFKTIDPSYIAQYDLYMLEKINSVDHLIKIESKASRSINKEESKGNYCDRALFSSDLEQYDMNFQQLKPNCCDVFIFIGVWLDKIRYWVLSSYEVLNHPSFSNQHRASKKTEDGKTTEGQIHIKPDTINQFSIYEVSFSNLESVVIKKYKEHHSIV